MTIFIAFLHILIIIKTLWFSDSLQNMDFKLEMVLQSLKFEVENVFWILYFQNKIWWDEGNAIQELFVFFLANCLIFQK